MEKISQPSTSTNIIVATTRINQNKPDSLSATGPAGFKMEGELSPQAARRSEDKTNVESSTPQRFIPRNNGILTSHSPKIDDFQWMTMLYRSRHFFHCKEV